MLEASNIRCRNGNFSLDVNNLCVPSGELHCLMGKSGSGKSTLLLALAGFLPIESGSVLVSKVSVENLPPEKRKIALVFQRSSLFPKMTVFENVEFGLRVQGIPSTERQSQVSELLTRFQILALKDRYPEQLSGGEAQRAAIARALAPKFPVLLLDEPFSSLDVELRNDLRALVKKTVKELGISALVVTHDPEDAAFFKEKTYRMMNGQLKGPV